MVKNMKDKGAIAILGGMGPEASAKMLEVMVSMATREFGAKDCRDFPEIIVDSIPLPDFISNKRNLPLATKILTNRVKQLQALNVSQFAIACNTAHILLDVLSSASSAPFVSMIDAVAHEAVGRGIKSVGLLATPSTIKSGLYQNALKPLGIEIILPSEKQVTDIEEVIRKVISGTNTIADSNKLAKIASSLKQKGAQAIILGCTELPLAFPKKFKLPTFDSIEVLSRALLKQFFVRK